MKGKPLPEDFDEFDTLLTKEIWEKVHQRRKQDQD
jgi:hypothetical protein